MKIFWVLGIEASLNYSLPTQVHVLYDNFKNSNLISKDCSLRM
ncbi:Uncharacterised protein [Klebsiella pneumoniae]|nr:Uncharacterised protein [Klebsiella pneumoniae]VGE36344.1 Uncharacterised protein [Klebsiella pneumoniae]